MLRTRESAIASNDKSSSPTTSSASLPSWHGFALEGATFYVTTFSATWVAKSPRLLPFFKRSYRSIAAIEALVTYPLAVALAGCPRHPPALRAAAVELATALYLERRPHRPLFPRNLWVLDAKSSANVDPGSVITVSYVL